MTVARKNNFPQNKYAIKCQDNNRRFDKDSFDRQNQYIFLQIWHMV